jgi:hypothetical protein
VISDERILGSSEFVETVLKSANEAYERKTVIQAEGINLDHLLGIVAAGLDIEIFFSQPTGSVSDLLSVWNIWKLFTNVPVFHVIENSERSNEDSTLISLALQLSISFAIFKNSGLSRS